MGFSPVASFFLDRFPGVERDAEVIDFFMLRVDSPNPKLKPHPIFTLVLRYSREITA